jgi:MATE family multidrug resistance protein
LAGYKPERDLFERLLRYGFPSGVHIMLEVFSFTLFVTFVGRIGSDSSGLAATAIAFQINGLAFIPMLGFSTAVNTMVGQALGDNNPALAERSTFSAAGLTFGYMTALALGYWFWPEVFMYPFAVQADAAEFARLRPVVVMLLHFVAFYCLFDTGNIIFTAALRGAGDTRFVMILSVVLSWVIFIIPTYICVRMGLGLKVVWSIMTVYVCVLATCFLLRFLGGKWKTMRVIEHVPPIVTAHKPDVPMIEA